MFFNRNVSLRFNVATGFWMPFRTLRFFTSSSLRDIPKTKPKTKLKTGIHSGHKHLILTSSHIPLLIYDHCGRCDKGRQSVSRVPLTGEPRTLCSVILLHLNCTKIWLPFSESRTSTVSNPVQSHLYTLNTFWSPLLEGPWPTPMGPAVFFARETAVCALCTSQWKS